jgi:hypothetical protein
MCHAGHVLVVDDTAVVRRLLTRAPTEEGDAVTLADHGAHAFQALETVAPCAIVLTGACRSWTAARSVGPTARGMTRRSPHRHDRRHPGGGGRRDPAGRDRPEALRPGAALAECRAPGAGPPVPAGSPVGGPGSRRLRPAPGPPCADRWRSGHAARGTGHGRGLVARAAGGRHVAVAGRGVGGAADRVAGLAARLRGGHRRHAGDAAGLRRHGGPARERSPRPPCPPGRGNCVPCRVADC